MKKRKLKRNVAILFILFTIFIIITFIIINFGKTSSKKEYSDEANAVIKENNKDDIYKDEYSKTLDMALKSGKYQEIYLEEYREINYIEDENFLDNINKYLNIGYKGTEINNIFKLSEKNQEKLLNLEKINFEKYINIKNFDANKIDRYNAYLESSEKDINTVVTYVNIGLDQEFYTQTKEVTNPHDITALINKYHYVSKDFVPKDLVVLFDSKQNAKMVKPAAEAFKLFIEAAQKDGYTLESTTAYRSYSFQNTLYTNYVKQDGVKEADTYSARPGTSEHQLGLAVDLNDPNVQGARMDEKDFKWVLENSYKYGFIVRYTEDGVPITGYMEEPWHIRYLGIELATKVYQSGLTYDEYYDLYMTEY